LFCVLTLSCSAPAELEEDFITIPPADAGGYSNLALSELLP